MDAFTGTEQPLRFGSFELDVRSRELRTGTKSVRLQEQPFEILRMMLERPGHVVSRDELRDRLWPGGTFVDFEHSLNAAVKRLRAALGDDADNPKFVETLPRRGYRFIASIAEGSASGGELPAGATPRVRLAVLPFTCLNDGGPEYFSDGLTEEMIAQLGQMYRGRIGVIARWSSMVFKGTTQRASEIGQALRADYLLEGSVRREGDRVRITARLVESASETHLWAESYDRPLTDCLSVQADVAARIAQSLAVELKQEDREPVPAHSGASTSASAYQEYLKGRYHWNKPDSALDEACSCFNEALRIDPDFGPAHAMVARVHIQRGELYFDQPRRALEAARTSAKRAIELEPSLAEAHLALGDVRRMLAWDWRGAELSYAQPIALNPSQENSHRRWGVMLAALGRRTEAIREAERAAELDPLCLVVSASAAWVRYLAADYEAAIDRCRRTLEMDPQYLAARRILGAAYLQIGRHTDALEVLEAAHVAAPGDAVLIAWLAHARAVTGDHDGAHDRLARWRRLDRTRYLPPFHLAIAHVGLGDLDAAFSLLEAATVEGDPALTNLAVEPRLEPLRSDPRYARLLELLGL